MSKKKRNKPNRLIDSLKRYWQSSLWHKILVVFITAFIFVVGVNYAVARWYIAKHANEPLKYGVTFVPNYARYYDLDPKEVLDAIINDLKVKQIRLVSYWDIMEPAEGRYDFSELDWQFDMAEKAGVEVSLAIGLRQPRWPECHMPHWAEAKSKPEWTEDLKIFIAKVIERYKTRSNLVSYQLENEFFMSVFGLCTDFTRQRLVEEFNLVKTLDPDRPVIVSRSNNWVGIPVGQPRPDVVGISVYKRVWDKTITKRYFEYPLPAWFYAMLAGWTELLTGRNMVIHELQAEPWVPNGYELKTAPLSEQNKSMNPERLKNRIEYGRATGMKQIDLWGAEWWYWRKVHFKDPSLWDIAKSEIARANAAQ